MRNFRSLDADPYSFLVQLTVAAVVGGAAFFLALPISILDPKNIAWLDYADLASQYLGWAFFRKSPADFPFLGYSEFGLDLASSIYFSDAIPLLALPLKAISSVLSEPFQYFGIWLLTCFFFQAFFAIRLAHQCGLPVVAAAGFSALVCLFPPLLLGMTQYPALSGHWLILATLSEYLRNGPRLDHRWATLCVIAAMVHSYIFVIVSAVWASHLLKDKFEGRAEISDLLFEAVKVIGSVTFFLWISGFFAISSGFGRFGYGQYQLKLLGPIDSGGFSSFLPDLPSIGDDYEGYSYLGAGWLLLIAVGIAATWKSRPRRVDRSLIPLFLVLAFMVVFAISNRVALADYLLTPFEVPDFLMPLTSSLRYSARLAWPAFYIALLFLLVISFKRFGKQTAFVIIAGCVAVQVTDVWPVLSLNRRLHADIGSRWPSPLGSKFWGEAAQTYDFVRRIPVGNKTYEWDVFAYYSLKNGLETDSVYFARVDKNKLADSQRRTEQLVTTARFSSDTLYVVDIPTARSVLARNEPNADVLSVDNFIVVAPRPGPRWRELNDVVPVSGANVWLSLKAGDNLSVASGRPGNAVLGVGWSIDGRGHVRAQGWVSELVFLLRPKGNVLQIGLHGDCLAQLPAGVVLTFNDQFIPHNPVSSDSGLLDVVVPTALIRSPPSPNVLQLRWGEWVEERATYFGSKAECGLPSLKTVTVSGPL